MTISHYFNHFFHISVTSCSCWTARSFAATYIPFWNWLTRLEHFLLFTVPLYKLAVTLYKFTSIFFLSPKYYILTVLTIYHNDLYERIEYSANKILTTTKQNESLWLIGTELLNHAVIWNDVCENRYTWLSD
jgi:hypothetical protein